MQTPRDVKAVLNSIKFYFPPVKYDVYYPDLCWLHLRRILHPELFNWIEHYLSEWAAVNRGNARANSDEVNMLSEALGKILCNGEVDSLRSPWSIKDFIPGVEPLSKEDEKLKIFVAPSSDELQALEQRKRLGSPSHYKYYFAFAAPSTALRDSEFASIIQLASEGKNALVQKLIQLSREARPTGGSWFDYFIDRIAQEPFEEWVAQHLSVFCFAISDVMDVALQSDKSARFMGRVSVSRQAGTLCFKMLQSLKSKPDETQYEDTLRDVFENGASIGWLTEEFLSSELWRHGKAGDRPKPETEWFMSEVELERARETILQRLKQLEERKRIAEYPDIASLLFRWREIDQNNLDEPRNWFAEQSQSEPDFVNLLQKMRGFSGSSEGISYPLRRPDVAPFCDWDAVKARLWQIANSKSAEQTLPDQARELLEAIQEHAYKD